MTIEQARRDTADNISQNYDFSYSVADASGWYTDGLPNTLAKIMFFEDPEDASAPTIKGTFTIEFEEDSAVPIDASCNVDGEIVGNIMGGELADYVVDEPSLML